MHFHISSYTKTVALFSAIGPYPPPSQQQETKRKKTRKNKNPHTFDQAGNASILHLQTDEAGAISLCVFSRGMGRKKKKLPHGCLYKLCKRA